MIPKIFSLFDPEGKMKPVGNNIFRWAQKSKEERQTQAKPLYEEFDKIPLFDPRQPLEGTNLLGAQFEVQTELGQGTTFTMTFDTKTKEVAI